MSLSIKQARDLLEVAADDVSDEQLEMEIETAYFLKTLFFELQKKEKKS